MADDDILSDYLPDTEEQSPPEAPAPQTEVQEQASPPQGQTEEKAPEQSPPQEQPPVELPEKFKGKSPEDIYRSYQELEKEYGRKANDLGMERQRRQYLEFLREQQQQPQYPTAPQAPAQSSPSIGEKGEGDYSELNQRYWDDPMGTITKWYRQTRAQEEAAIRQQQEIERQETQRRQLTEAYAAVNSIRAIDPEIDDLLPRMSAIEKAEPNLLQGAVDTFDKVNRLYREAKKRRTSEFEKIVQQEIEKRMKPITQAQRNAAVQGMGTGNAATRANNAKAKLTPEQIREAELLGLPEEDWW